MLLLDSLLELIVESKDPSTSPITIGKHNHGYGSWLCYEIVVILEKNFSKANFVFIIFLPSSRSEETKLVFPSPICTQGRSQKEFIELPSPFPGNA